MLSRYRVLDLADDRGIFCGRLLGDLGADIIAVEPPWGNEARRMGPFYQDIPDIEGSLYWGCFAINKRSVTLDIEKSDGRDLLLRLVESADFLVESSRPGYLDGLGLGYQALREVNPRLVVVSITPFGQEGPYRDYAATDLVGMALSGFMYLTGDEDRPPVRVTAPQFWTLGGAAGAAGAMVAHEHRARTGLGQHVDVSCQQAMARTLSHAPQFWDLNRVVLKRRGPFRPMGAGSLRINWECADGYVNFIQTGGITGGRNMAALCKWMEEDGYGDVLLSSTDFGTLGFGQISAELLEAMNTSLARFFKAKTKEYLAMGALKRRVLLFPVNDPADVYSYPQLAARGYFQDVEAPDGQGTYKTLGPYLRFSAQPITYRRRAPRLGEHNGEVYGELGMDAGQLVDLRERGVV